MVDNPMRLNTMAVGLGDQLLQDTDPIGALKCFRIVQSKDQLLRFQAARLKTLQDDIDHNLDEIRKDPTNAAKIAELRTANTLTEGKIEKGKATQAELEKLPDFMPGIILRIGQSYFDQNKQWEAIAAYTELLREYPEPRPETEPALYSLIVASANANRGAFAQALCERYLKEFPKEKNAGTVWLSLRSLCPSGSGSQGCGSRISAPCSRSSRIMSAPPRCASHWQCAVRPGQVRGSPNDIRELHQKQSRWGAEGRGGVSASP